MECGVELIRAIIKKDSIYVSCILSRKGVNPNIGTINGNSPLIIAIRQPNRTCVRLLLQCSNIDVNKKSIDGTPPLTAAFFSDFEMFVMLVTHKDIDINSTDSHGHTSLYFASYINANVCLILLTRGARLPYNCTTGLDPIAVKQLTAARIALPRWNRFNTHKHYPLKVNETAKVWLLCCKRLGILHKDLRYLVIEYIADAWKFSIN